MVALGGGDFREPFDLKVDAASVQCCKLFGRKESQGEGVIHERQVVLPRWIVSEFVSSKHHVAATRPKETPDGVNPGTRNVIHVDCWVKQERLREAREVLPPLECNFE